MAPLQAERHRDYVGPITNTDIWNEFELRSDDIIVDTPPKCGTTWMLHQVMMLIHGRAVENAGGSDQAPWLDCGFRDREAIKGFLGGLERRRCIKSHTPMDGVPYAADLTYIVVYRHPVDAHFSMRTHVDNMTPDWLDFLFEGDERQGFRRFVSYPLTDMGTDDFTLASIVHHYLQARRYADRGNVHFFHYADMRRDPAGQMDRLAGIMGIDLAPALRDELVEATSFGSMRKAVETSERRFHKDSPFRDLAHFYAEGTSNKWEGRLTAEDMAAYAARLAELLPPADAAWLEWGDRGRA